jgi:hypothetical protein
VTRAADPPAVGDHYRPTTDGHHPGVFRVVGADGRVALLRVADADGRRVTTGDLRHVDDATLREEFAPAEDPDAGLTPIRSLRNALSGLYWSVRRFL